MQDRTPKKSLKESLELLKSRLAKGAMKRLAAFDPATAITPEQGRTINEWQRPDHNEDNTRALLPEKRNEAPRMEGAARTRALHKLAGKTEVKTIDGERHFLLHRGMNAEEHQSAIKDGRINHANSSSWTPFDRTANNFAAEYKGHKVSAWVPEKSIQTVPMQYGDPDPKKLESGPNIFRVEHEVIVSPQHNSTIHSSEKVTSFRPSFPEYRGSKEGVRTLHNRINEKDRVFRQNKNDTKHQMGTPYKLAILKDHAKALGKSEELRKMPAPYGGGVTPDYALNEKPDGEPTFTRKLPSGLTHHVYDHSEDGGDLIIHRLHHGKKAIAQMEIRHNENDGDSHPAVDTAEVHEKYQKKGVGQQLYQAALEYHGSLESDATITPGANKIWRRLARIKAVDANLAPFGRGHHDDPHRAELAENHIPNKHYPKLKLGKSLAQLHAFEQLSKSVLKVPLANGLETKVVRNPSETQAHNIHSKSKDGVTRYFAHPNGDLYMWDAFDLSHGNVMEHLGVEHTSDNYAGAGTITSHQQAQNVARNFRTDRGKK